MNDRFICVDAYDVVVKLIKGNVPETGLVLVPMVDGVHDQVGPGDVRQADGSFTKPVVALPDTPVETVADLLAQIEELKAKVEALEPAVVP